MIKVTGKQINGCRLSQKFYVLNKPEKKIRIFIVSKDKVAVFKQTELFRDLNEDVLRILARRAVEKTLNRNEILFLAGEEATGFIRDCNGRGQSVSHRNGRARADNSRRARRGDHCRTSGF